MRKRIIWLSLITIILGMAADGWSSRMINCQVSVREKATTGDSGFVLIEKKDFAVTEGVKNTTFMVNFTLDLAATYNDSGFFNCTLSVFTLGPQAQTYFKRFQSQPGGVYFIDNIRGKANVEYRVGVSLLSIDTTGQSDDACDYDFRRDGVWNFDPSAHFDLYFVPKSLADARWNMLRDFLESNYKDFKELFQFDFPGKINCFLAPCVLPQVTWDNRMGYAIDPPRSNCFMLYSHGENTVDPIPAYLVRIYRYLGYAPPLLAEGMAAYFDFPHYFAGDIRRADKLPPLSMLLKSIDYYSLPQQENISAASSFVKFLIDTYGPNKFRQLYAAATDLTIQNQFPTIYDKTLPQLESEWHHLLDTTQFVYGHFRYFYERDRYIGRDYGMDRFLEAMKPRVKTFEESLYVYTQEGWNRYMRGDYDTARTLYQTVMRLSPTDGATLMIYGNLLLIDGRYDSARVIYERVMRVDTSLKTALNKVGESYYWENNLDSAREYLLRDVSQDPSQLSQASSNILLGELALRAKDTAAAVQYYDRARLAMEQIYESGKTWPAYLLRLGQAHLGLAMCGQESLETARSFLESALYFEVYPTRVIFATRILKELGQVADLAGEREKAIAYYQKALTYPLPPELEAEVRRYITRPFAGY